MTEQVDKSIRSIGLRGRGGSMVLRAMLAQNVGTGCAFGGLGVSVLALQARFDASLGTAALTLALVVMTMTGLGPLLSDLIARWGLRRLMTTGVFISMLGYVALAFAPSMTFALAACALLIGPGAALFATVPPAVLAGNWYPHARGRVTGIVYLPLLVTVLPLIGVFIIQRYGLSGFFLSLAGLHLLLLPLMMGVMDPPQELLEEQYASYEPMAGISRKVILGTGIFWLIVLGDGLLMGTTIAGSVHILPIVKEYGFSEGTGALLLSIYGAGSILGSLFAGYASDNIGSAKTLGFAALCAVFAWLLIAVTNWLPVLTVSAFLIGLYGASVFPPISALIVETFGFEGLSSALGLMGIMAVPFTTAMSPAAGWLRDTYGSYQIVYISFVASCAVATVIFFGIARKHARRAMSGEGLAGASLSPTSAV